MTVVSVEGRLWALCDGSKCGGSALGALCDGSKCGGAALGPV